MLNSIKLPLYTASKDDGQVQINILPYVAVPRPSSSIRTREC